ncbi:MAG: hypothetical protein ACC631_10070 [Halocynthiibacter sp.]
MRIWDSMFILALVFAVSPAVAHPPVVEPVPIVIVVDPTDDDCELQEDAVDNEEDDECLALPQQEATNLAGGLGLGALAGLGVLGALAGGSTTSTTGTTP